MIEIMPARNGQLTAQADGRALYSRYDPAAEAVRFVKRELASAQQCTTVMILGEGLGYLTAALRTLQPAARIVAIHLHAALFARRICDADQQWCVAESDRTFEQFLQQQIADEEIDGLLLMTWEPCTRAFAAQAEPITAVVRSFLDQRSATLATERYYGARWVSNSVTNAIELQPLPGIKGRNAPVAIAAAGPSLPESLELLRRRDRGVSLWALPSALPILLHAGCLPDLVVTTDAGFYATHHLRLLRTCPNIPVAAPLSAALIPQLRRRPTLILNQGSWFEHDLLSDCGLPWVAIPAHGTVAGSAWYLAAAVGATEVVFAGLDLCIRDIRSHPRGHAFEPLLYSSEQRLRPVHHVLFERNVVTSRRIAEASTERTSRALRTYAAWFRGHAAAMPIPASRLVPSPVDTALAPCTRLPRCADAGYAGPATPAGTVDRRRALHDCLSAWQLQTEELHSALRTGGTQRDQRQQRLLAMARTVDTAGYLQALRALRNNDQPDKRLQYLQRRLQQFFDHLRRRVEQAA